MSHLVQLGYHDENGEEMIAVEFVYPSNYIQDSHKGAYVVRQSSSETGSSLTTTDTDESDIFDSIFVFDPHLRIECMYGVYSSISVDNFSIVFHFQILFFKVKALKHR